MIQNGYASRNIPSPDAYKNVYERRIAAKRSGDKATANSLKLILNTCYGATLNQYNELYDPLHARSVCISGQLYLLELVCHLMKDVPGLIPVNLNTDGLMVEFDDGQYDQVRGIVDEWQKRTGFNLEEDVIERYYAKDCNSYIEMAQDGSIKKKGGYLVRGIAPAGAFNINNNAVIVADAVTEYFINGTPPEETVNACNDISKFQMIAKAGSKYKEAYHIVDGKREGVQKVNRVYAAKDSRYGKLHKVKADDGMDAQIESLPEHCLIDNSAIDSPGHTTTEDIDKSWYIALARKRIDDFLGTPKPKKNRNQPVEGQERMDLTMAATTPTVEQMNVYQKLLGARADFLEAAVKKSGKNMKLRYTYFELDDIVPTAIPIFQKWHLFPLTYFPDSNTSIMQVINIDKPEEKIIITAPFKEIDPIISSTTGGEVTNAMQRLGSAITYMRRYLYMLALDIVEADEIEQNMTVAAGVNETPAQDKPKAPASPAERQEIKAKLTLVSDNADELLLKALKTACEKLAKAGAKEMVTKIALETENYTKVSKADCEALITAINARLNEGEKQ